MSKSAKFDRALIRSSDHPKTTHIHLRSSSKAEFFVGRVPTSYQKLNWNGQHELGELALDQVLKILQKWCSDGAELHSTI